MPPSRLDVCIPAYNEEAIIEESITLLLRALSDFPYEVRVIVVDNGSTDRTAEIIREIAHPAVSLLSVPERGKGAAIRAAARESDAAWFGFIDADLSASPDDIPNLFAFLEKDEADIVIGSRLTDPSVVRRALLRTLSSQCFNSLRRLILGVSVQDSQCGLKLMNAKGKEVARACLETGWFFDMELLARGEKRKLRIKETPIHWDEHRFAGRASKLSVVRDGIAAIIAMVRIRRSLGIS